MEIKVGEYYTNKEGAKIKVIHCIDDRPLAHPYLVYEYGTACVYRVDKDGVYHDRKYSQFDLVLNPKPKMKSVSIGEEEIQIFVETYNKLRKSILNESE